MSEFNIYARKLDTAFKEARSEYNTAFRALQEAQQASRDANAWTPGDSPEEKQASKIKRKIEKNYTKDEPDKRPEVKSEPQKDAEETPPAKQERVEKPKQDFLVAPQPKKPPPFCAPRAKKSARH